MHPDMIDGMTQSLKEASPHLINEVKTLAGDISNAMTPQIANYEVASGGMGFNSMVEAFKTALSEMKIELDDEVAGKFVRDTVTKAIYT